MRFYFDYIYYRMTELYFKWDGRKGITSIIAIVMIKMVLFMITAVILSLTFYTTEEISNVPKVFKYAIVLPYLYFSYFTFKKHENSFNRCKNHWKNETKLLRIVKGIIVFLSFAIPWLIFILIIVKRDFISSILYLGL